MLSGIELITDERHEQIQDHGRTVNHDVKVNNLGQLKSAAITLLEEPEEIRKSNRPANWCVDIWERMCSKNEIERLTISGALIAAEIDRLQKLES